VEGNKVIAGMLNWQIKTIPL